MPVPTPVPENPVNLYGVPFTQPQVNEKWLAWDLCMEPLNRTPSTVSRNASLMQYSIYCTDSQQPSATTRDESGKQARDRARSTYIFARIWTPRHGINEPRRLDLETLPSGKEGPLHNYIYELCCASSPTSSRPSSLW